MKNLAIESSKEIIREALLQCRALTLELFASIDPEIFCPQAHPEFSPVGWHLGHIAFIESSWILQHLAGLPPMLPQYRRLWTADGLPKEERQNLPPIDVIYDYLNTVRERVLAYLETAPVEKEEKLWHWLVQHESHHNETVSFILSLHACNGKNVTSLVTSQVTKAANSLSPIENDFQTSEMVEIPAGEFEMGSNEVYALDCERLAHRFHLDSYWIDPYPVTCGQYRQFMEAGGYQQRELWSDAGWKWLEANEANEVSRPLYWSDSTDWDDCPVCGVSWYEADAYARFVGKRLPSEAEWEKAASWDARTGTKRLYPWGTDEPSAKTCNHSNSVGHVSPVNVCPDGQSAYGCFDMLGNVWEWTDSWFEGYEGFESFPYTGFSQLYFDRQHRVLRGGSWASRRWVLRCSARNWYNPWVRQILAGFRCAR
ncbi:MAG: ergothioneine biosynthesis protein EgtB [Oscillatoria sp. SIO1A7]|nr:ergothioneine biosynthesis protein EgtB [Oscillatoria sp. SIO1A7]